MRAIHNMKYVKNGSLVKPKTNMKWRNEIQPEMNLKLSL